MIVLFCKAKKGIMMSAIMTDIARSKAKSILFERESFLVVDPHFLQRPDDELIKTEDINLTVSSLVMKQYDVILPVERRYKNERYLSSVSPLMLDVPQWMVASEKVIDLEMIWRIADKMAVCHRMMISLIPPSDDNPDKKWVYRPMKIEGEKIYRFACPDHRAFLNPESYVDQPDKEMLANLMSHRRMQNGMKTFELQVCGGTLIEEHISCRPEMIKDGGDAD